MKHVFLLVILLCVGCPSSGPGPVAPPAPDASDASVDEGVQVCAHLAAIGCPQPPTCAALFDKNEGRFAEFKPKCLLAASNSLEANTCGSIRCGDGG